MTHELGIPEILFLGYMCRHKKAPKSFAGYWHYKYGINANETLTKLIDLKIICAYESKYAATEEGEQYLPFAEFLWYFHSNSVFGVALERAVHLSKSNPSLNKHKIMEIALLQDLAKHKEAANWGSCSSTLNSLAQTYEKEERYEEALSVSLEDFFLSINGLHNGGFVETKRDAAKFTSSTVRIIAWLIKESGADLQSIRTQFISRTNAYLGMKLYYSPEEAYSLLMRKLRK